MLIVAVQVVGCASSGSYKVFVKSHNLVFEKITRYWCAVKTFQNKAIFIKRAIQVLDNAFFREIWHPSCPPPSPLRYMLIWPQPIQRCQSVWLTASSLMSQRRMTNQFIYVNCSLTIARTCRVYVNVCKYGNKPEVFTEIICIRHSPVHFDAQRQNDFISYLYSGAI